MPVGSASVGVLDLKGLSARKTSQGLPKVCRQKNMDYQWDGREPWKTSRRQSIAKKEKIDASVTRQ
ncbi:hypothetical protein [Mesorhizobium sp. M0500]|uniref:hypothetical protein n=1 Tax=Mesorhizobium sp. M0500 TaxID=2956953 RepID=UPI00333957FD